MGAMRLSQIWGDNIWIDRSAILIFFAQTSSPLLWLVHHLDFCRSTSSPLLWLAKLRFPPAEIEHALFLRAALSACGYTVRILSHDKIAGFSEVVKHRVAAALRRQYRPDCCPKSDFCIYIVFVMCHFNDKKCSFTCSLPLCPEWNSFWNVRLQRG